MAALSFVLVRIDPPEVTLDASGLPTKVCTLYKITVIICRGWASAWRRCACDALLDDGHYCINSCHAFEIIIRGASYWVLCGLC